ncbi:hypothetical protein Tco_0802399 [Tanacetum coccineum]|uniref:Uncharacterized protein n=1 Tax=Tanacetum coccineum TaxID=301880 RepID=A0ABQ5A1F8_9ASTR
MSNQLEDIQVAGSDTHPPMLDMTDFESWHNEFGYSIREKIMESTYFSLLIKAHSRWDSTEMRLLQDNVKMLLEGSELTKDDRESQLYDEFEHFRQHKDEEQLLFLAGRQTNTFDDDVDEGLVQDMAQNEDNIFQADQCNASDSDVDEAPTNQTMFMANLSSADLVYDEAGPSYDSDTLSEVQDHDNCLDNMNESPEEHEMHNDVQPIDVVDSDTKYTSNSNIISYKQYVQDNEDQFVHSDVSSVPNDAIMIITNDIYEKDAQCVTSNKPNNTVNASLTAKLARYKELAEVYEKRAQCELTERELMIDT